jgi:hypothetical protein
MQIHKTSLFYLSITLLLFSSFTQVEKWVWSESKTYGYKIEFPQKPEETVQELDSEIGKLKLNLKSYEVSETSPADDNLMYLVNCTVFPETLVHSDFVDKQANFFRATIDGAVAKIGGKIISEKDIKINSFPGREVKIDYNEGKEIIFMRLYLVKNKLFVLETITPTQKVPNEAISRFLNSFQLL